MIPVVLAQEPSPGNQPVNAKQESSDSIPDVAEIMVMESKLSGRLKVLEIQVTGLVDLAEYERECASIEANLTSKRNQFQSLKDAKDFRLAKLVSLREEIKRENLSFEKASKPLNRAIRQLGTWRNEWLAEKRHWSEWQSSLFKEEGLDQLKTTFSEANEKIEKALHLVSQKLQVIMKVRDKAGNIQEDIYKLVAELDDLISTRRRGVLISTSPPMLSSMYFSQFGVNLWYAVKEGFEEIAWLDIQFFVRNGWIVFLQVFISFLVIIPVHRNRQVLIESKRYQFLAERPFSAALFLATMATMGLYEYEGASVTWKLILRMVSAISFVRLVGGLNQPSERREFVCWLVVVLILTSLFEWIRLPLPLFRLYLVLTAFVGFLLCLRWAGESTGHKESGFYTWIFRSFSLMMAVTIVMELFGKHALAHYLFTSSLSSIALVVTFLLFRYVIRGTLQWLFRSSPLRRAAVLYRDTDTMIRQAELFIDTLLWGLVFTPAVLFIWKVYDTLAGATQGFWTFGLKLGPLKISVGLLIALAVIIYSSFLGSWILQKLLTDQVLARSKVEIGVRHAMTRLVHYVTVFLGFLLALSVLGLDITKLTIMLSALGVGIGFGLQSVANNFISGIILLFERPVRVGDMVVIGEQWAMIKKIGLRSTTVTTFDEADLIIPNANLVNNEVTNWTLSNRRARLIITVGVAYGSDVPLVMETLTACGRENEWVAKTPDPYVLFLGFGDSSLDFELRVWVMDIDQRLNAMSQIHQEIDRRFRKAKIEIAFPQRDLHLRSLDESIMLRPLETPK